MKGAVFAYTRRGLDLAVRLRACLPDWEIAAYAPERLAGGAFAPIPNPSEAFYGEQFREQDALVFVGACGIAVRCIAPHVRDKRTDPAVLCVDETGSFVIPLLSGHIGGANALAAELAAVLGATAAVTTATDVNGRFSVDAWAAERGFVIGDMAAAKAVSAAILERDIPLDTPLPVLGQLPPGLVRGDSGELGIYIGWDTRCPFARTLRLIPKSLCLGLGCRKGISAAAVAEAVDAVLTQAELDPRAVRRAASIDLKAGEAGLLEFCRSHGLPIAFYTPEELQAVPGDFTPSAFVEQVTGVDNVCERAALLGADRLLVRKTVRNGVTVAVAAEKTEVRFGEAACGGHRPG